MLREEFYAALSRYFTDEQIDNLDSYAPEMVDNSQLSGEYRRHCGRLFVMSLLVDMTGDSDPIESISGISGGISIEGYERMVSDIDNGLFWN